MKNIDEYAAPGWKTAAACIFFIASIIFHLFIVTHITDPYLRGMHYDTINTPDPGPGIDFNALYTQAKNLTSGRSIYPTVDELLGKRKAQSPESEGAMAKSFLPPFRYLPIAALVGWPFTLLAFSHAYNAWIVFHEILMLIALCLLFKSTPDKNLRLVLGGMLLFFSPYYVEVFQGQFSWPQALLMLLCFYHLEIGSASRGMWSFIASVLWKLNTLLWVIPLAMAGYWRWLAVLAAAVLIGSVPYFIVHPEDVRTFIGINARPDLTHSYHFGNSGLRMLIDFILRRIDYISGGSVADMLLKYLSTAVALVIFLLTVLAAWRRRDEVVSNLLIFGTIYYLIYVDVWAHHWMMLLPILLWEYRRTKSPFIFVIWLIIALPNRFDWIGDFNQLREFFPHPERAPNFAASLLYFSQKALPALALWIWQLRRLYGRRKSITEA